MKHIPLDTRESMPTGMKKYIDNFGWHFNRKAYEYATEFMKKENHRTKEKEKVVPYTKKRSR